MDTTRSFSSLAGSVPEPCANLRESMAGPRVETLRSAMRDRFADYAPQWTSKQVGDEDAIRDFDLPQYEVTKCDGSETCRRLLSSACEVDFSFFVASIRVPTYSTRVRHCLQLPTTQSQDKCLAKPWQASDKAKTRQRGMPTPASGGRVRQLWAAQKCAPPHACMSRSRLANVVIPAVRRLFASRKISIFSPLGAQMPSLLI
ncbi:hypothetical protein IWZ01DRAFT_508900 [Phyllosticta capitalensis]